ncbi:hypothetical protein [Paludisphaera rhizosphaerae]|uniref:hypothetical protein n=1 Tax=Paludisphaera rhizosphaerae TaxID=2711216 RepID=UPI00197D49A7|nr:hypothetical protein [Paludisphaera rhizosphaerae]
MIRNPLKTWLFLTVLLGVAGASRGESGGREAIEIGSRREPFVDGLLIDSMDGVALRLQRPVDRGPAFAFDEPWEGPFSGYVTILHAGPKFQAYYRGSISGGKKDTGDHQVVCYAESDDGVRWTKPALPLFPRDGRATTNIVLADVPPDTHNFAPMIDSRPGVDPAERYKALGGYNEPGLNAYVSADGVHWKKWRDAPVFTRADAGSQGAGKGFLFDSQNVSFWSPAEGKYLLFYRVYKDGKRRIARAESDDYASWKSPTLMEYRRKDGSPAPVEQLYTSQTHPYFRAPHIYIATAARFMLGRRAITPEQAAAIHVDPNYFNDSSDAVLMTSRGGGVYDRTFMEAFVAPGIGAENWTSRTNYPALNVVQTGPNEMSLYVNQNYGQPTSHLRRYSLRLDGFASVHADYDGGEMRTRPLRFQGSQLLLNFATSAAGGVKVEIQDENGSPIPGFALSDCRELIGNDVDRPATFAGGDLQSLAGRVVRLRFVLKDADLYALRFAPK